jgi:alkyl hydroperoxide reductase subunit AhpF
MSYEQIIKQYLTAIHEITLEYCNADDFISFFLGSSIELKKIECKKPLIVVRKNGRIFFSYYGIPEINELWPFLNALVRISNNKVQLDSSEREIAATISGNIKLFVTPDCTKCPIAAELLYQLPIINEKINLEIIDITTYAELGEKYRVLSVPKIILNDKIELPGSFPPNILLKMLSKSSNKNNFNA